MKLPNGHQQVMPYLILDNASRFLDFAKNVLQAKEVVKYLNDDGSIMHAEISIGESRIMFGNSNDTWPSQTSGLFIYHEMVDEAYKKALAYGARSIMEPEDKDYGRSCGIKDPEGNSWWFTSVPEG